jgi:hypothetical protein
MLLVQSGRGRRGGGGKGTGRKGGGAAAAQQARRGERPLDSDLATAALCFLGKLSVANARLRFLCLLNRNFLPFLHFLWIFFFTDN